MKTQSIRINFKASQKGFALTVTLTLMILLTILALGLLTLSSITLRASTRDNEMNIAKANAHLALQLAIADLQKSAGPDQRITATAATILPISVPPAVQQGQPMLTGVWKSRKLDPNAPDTVNDQDKAGRAAHFVKWLTSSGNPAATEAQDFATGDISPDRAQVLVSEKVVGNDASAMEVSAERVNVMDTDQPTLIRGTYAYAVLDEGVKASINVGTSRAGSGLAEQSAALGGGQQPGIDRLDLPAGAGNFTLATVNLDRSVPEGRTLVDKLVSRGSGGLGLGLDLPTASNPGALGEHFHDLTPYSLGLLTNVADGGFKRDLNLLAELPALPPEYSGKKIYETSFSQMPDVDSDPSWAQAFAYTNLFKPSAVFRPSPGEPQKRILFKSGGIPTVNASAPASWAAGSFVTGGSAIPTTGSPSGPVLLPSVAKVQVVFTICARDMASYPKGATITGSEPSLSTTKPWWRPDLLAGTGYNYLLHLTYTPVVTLHNPYNVPLEIGTTDSNHLKVDFVNVPMAVKVFRNNEPQTNGFVPFSRMYQGLYNFTTGTTKARNPSKRFGLRLAAAVDSNGKSTGVPIRLLPGEVRVFSAWVPPTRTWAQEEADPKYFDDWASSQTADGVDNSEWTKADTSNAVGVAGWNGAGLGFDVYAFGLDRSDDEQYETVNSQKKYRGFTIPLRLADSVHLEFAPIVNPETPDTPGNPRSFTVEMTLKGANPDQGAITSIQHFLIEDPAQLPNKMLGAASRRIPTEDGYSTADLFDHSSLSVSEVKNFKTFALFSAYAKTTRAGLEKNISDGAAGFTSYDNGRYATKPWLFNNHAALVGTQRLVSENSSQRSHEMALTQLPGKADDAIKVNGGTARGRFITGHTGDEGIEFGTLFEIPLGPVQNPTAFNVAGLATSYNQPCFVQPVGNSYAHPLLDTSEVQRGSGPGRLVDHSFMLNSIFYDGYYCSGIQSRSNVFGDGTTCAELADTFFKSESKLSDPRLTAYRADGITNDQALEKIVPTASYMDGFKQVAAHQLVKGAFNVNSTSEGAWKALLSAMSGKGAKVLQVGDASATAVNSDLEQLAADFNGARFSRFRLPNGQPLGSGGTGRELYWQGGRDLTEAELDSLAREIVIEVKARGPFLSMGEFVNRQLGGVGPLTLSGALQAAIDKAGVNPNNPNYKAGYIIDSFKTQDLGLPTPRALEGSSAAGAPGYLMQADILNVLGNAATVRSDTFVIRTYGDARDANGRITARAWCEAVIQRIPDYVDQVDAATTAPADLTSPANVTFGRRFLVQSFRYLLPDEV
ncbi:MAG: hypothetical protein H7Y36_00735 [Armatimonadetes bacterium]|nr:hypothetical protein [Akkermansiaceae bacterium]